ncbi:MAG TPA: hypothetical protein VLJ21_05405 [Candidatus Binatia bacterium]|nr:hypothetical protein [Candidatus Binatia bacterium]
MDVGFVIRLVAWFVVLAALIMLFFAYLKLPRARFRTILGWLTLAFFFSTLRWLGGKLVRNGIDFTAAPWFEWVWLVLISTAAICTFVAARQLYLMATDVESLVGKPVHEKATQRKHLNSQS